MRGGHHAEAASFTDDPLNLLTSLESWRDNARDILDSIAGGGCTKWRWEFSQTTSAIVLWCDSQAINIDPAPLAEYERLLRDNVAPTRIFDPTDPLGYRLPHQESAEVLQEKLEAARHTWQRILDLGLFLCQQRDSKKPQSGTQGDDATSEAEAAKRRTDEPNGVTPRGKAGRPVTTAAMGKFAFTRRTRKTPVVWKDIVKDWNKAHPHDTRRASVSAMRSALQRYCSKQKKKRS